MIVFDLKCSRGHVFEAWFGSSDDYAAQQARGLVACPLCNDAAVEKAAMAPAVAAKSNTRRDVAPADATAQLLARQRRFEAGSRWVGNDFAREARLQHEAGTSGAIHGTANLREVKALVEDGIPVAPLPFAPLANSDA